MMLSSARNLNLQTMLCFKPLSTVCVVSFQPVTFTEFNSIHPFAPADQVKGYQMMFDELSRQLIDITGYDKVSLQPNR